MRAPAALRACWMNMLPQECLLLMTRPLPLALQHLLQLLPPDGADRSTTSSTNLNKSMERVVAS